MAPYLNKIFPFPDNQRGSTIDKVTLGGYKALESLLQLGLTEFSR